MSKQICPLTKEECNGGIGNDRDINLECTFSTPDEVCLFFQLLNLKKGKKADALYSE